MAKKDTINALMKRDVSEEVANLIMSKYVTLGAIADAGVDGLVALGIEQSEAESIIDRWEDELDDDEDYEPDEYFSD